MSDLMVKLEMWALFFLVLTAIGGCWTLGNRMRPVETYIGSYLWSWWRWAWELLPVVIFSIGILGILIVSRHYW